MSNQNQMKQADLSESEMKLLKTLAQSCQTEREFHERIKSKDFPGVKLSSAELEQLKGGKWWNKIEAVLNCGGLPVAFMCGKTQDQLNYIKATWNS